MSEIIRTYGLGLNGAAGALARSVETGAGRLVEDGPGWEVYRNDTVIETAGDGERQRRPGRHQRALRDAV
jgi:hypothetical protein